MAQNKQKRKQPLSFESAIRRTAQKYGCFEPEAYIFVFDALPVAQRMVMQKRPPTGSEFHISGPELLEGIRALAAKQFGYMAKSVFETWGIKSTEDFGRIVFHLVDAEMMRKTDDDTLDDFRDGFDFGTAFEADSLYLKEWKVD